MKKIGTMFGGCKLDNLTFGLGKKKKGYRYKYAEMKDIKNLNPKLEKY
jgi:hypothetical protein